MSEQTAEIQSYAVNIQEPEDEDGALVFTFVPRGLQEGSGIAAITRRAPQFVVVARDAADGLAFDWSQSPDDPGAAAEEIQTEIAARVNDRGEWIDHVRSLVDQVEKWAKEMDWSTRRIEKKIEDKHIGTHRVPALLMQEETFRVLLEPLGRTAPGVEGVVDLYLMPAYDDIARLFYENDCWNIHFFSNISKPRTSAGTDETVPLSKGTLEGILTEMKKNAA